MSHKIIYKILYDGKEFETKCYTQAIKMFNDKKNIFKDVKLIKYVDEKKVFEI